MGERERRSVTGWGRRLRLFFRSLASWLLAFRKRACPCFYDLLCRVGVYVDFFAVFHDKMHAGSSCRFRVNLTGVSRCCGPVDVKQAVAVVLFDCDTGVLDFSRSTLQRCTSIDGYASKLSVVDTDSCSAG